MIDVPSKIDPSKLPYELRIGELVKWAAFLDLRLELCVVRRVRKRAPRRRRKKA